MNWQPERDGEYLDLVAHGESGQSYRITFAPHGDACVLAISAAGRALHVAAYRDRLPAIRAAERAEVADILSCGMAVVRAESAPAGYALLRGTDCTGYVVPVDGGWQVRPRGWPHTWRYCGPVYATRHEALASV